MSLLLLPSHSPMPSSCFFLFLKHEMKSFSHRETDGMWREQREEEKWLISKGARMAGVGRFQEGTCTSDGV